MSNTFSCGFQCPSLQGNYPRKLEFIDCVRGALTGLDELIVLIEVIQLIGLGLIWMFFDDGETGFLVICFSCLLSRCRLLNAWFWRG